MICNRLKQVLLDSFLEIIEHIDFKRLFTFYYKHVFHNSSSLLSLMQC
jgi:hypothetical protein